MLPLLEELAVELAGKAEIVKFNCNKHNKELGQSLGVKVAPTFHIYREESKVQPLERSMLMLLFWHRAYVQKIF